MDSLPKITKEKILQNTINSTEFCNVAELHKVLPKLCVRVYPELEEVDFYGGHSIPEHDYVPASSWAQRALRERRDSKRIRKRCELSNLLHHFKQGQLNFIGQAGSGKSTLLKAIACEVIDGKYEGLKDVDIVHHIQCHNFRQGDKITLGELLFQNMNPRLSDEEIKQTLEYAATNPDRFLFILDSLDTLSCTIDGVYEQLCVDDRASPGAVLWNFLAGKLVPGCRIITSSREHSIRNYNGEVRAQKVIALVGFSMDSIRKIIVGYMGEKVAEEIMQYMEKKSPTLMDLSATPVFLTYNLVGFKCGDDFKASTMSGILIQLLNSLTRSPHAHEEDILEVINKLQELSFTGTKERRVLFSTEEFALFGLEPKAVTDLAILAPGRLTQRILLGSHLMFFAHQSIQELLTAMYIAQMPREPFLTFLKGSIHTAHYAVVRRILCGLLLDDEVKDQAEQYFQGNLNMKENEDLLRQSLREQLSQSMYDADALELYLSLSEAKDGMKETINSFVQKIRLSRMPLSLSDAHAVGWVASNCKQLSMVSLTNCYLTSATVNALVLNLRDCDLKMSELWLHSNPNMGVAGLKSVGEICKRSKVEILLLANCNLSPQQLQALNDGLGSAKLSALHLSENTAMGKEGLQTVGKISKQCRVQKLVLECSELSSKELQALKEGLDSAKLSTLRLRNNTEMGEEGLKTVGGISKQCRVEELDLNYCELTSQELQALKEGLDLAKIQKLMLKGYNESKSTSYEDILAFSELIPHVTELLNLTECKINKEDADYLQQQLDRCSPTELEITYGFGTTLSQSRQMKPEQTEVTDEEGEKEDEFGASASGNSQICDPRQPPAQSQDGRAESSLQVPSEKKVPGFIEALRKDIEDKIRSNVTKRVYIGSGGGTAGLYGCTITFPPNAFDKDTPVDLTVGPDGIQSYPDQYVPFTPIFGCSLSGARLMKSATVKLPVYCMGGEFVVLSNKMKDGEWIPIADATLDEKNARIEFEVAHFCGYAGFIWKMLSSLGRFIPWRYRLHNLLYYRRKPEATLIVVTIIDDEKILEDCRKRFDKPELQEVLELPYAMLARSGDFIQFKLDCPVSAKPAECQLKNLHELIMVKYDMSRFRLTVPPESGALYHFQYGIEKNGKREKEFPLSVNVGSPQEQRWMEATDVRNPQEQRQVEATTVGNPREQRWVEATNVGNPQEQRRGEAINVGNPREMRQAEETDRVGRIAVRNATRDFYEAHVVNDQFYKFPRDRPKGRALVINNTFADDCHLRRDGSNVDVRNMKLLWENFGIRVTVVENLSAAQMREIVRSFAQNIGNVSLSVVVIMSHGEMGEEDDAIICENRGTMMVGDVLREFNDDHCPHLVGIPKLFFLQCCRGYNILAADRPDAQEEAAITSVSDRLVAYATQRNYVAYRNEADGSWFINAITNIFMRQAHELDVLNMLSLVNQAVSRRRAQSENEDVQGRQVGEKRDSFRKILFLFPGWP